MTSKLSDIDSRASWGSGPAPEFDLFPDEDDHDYASRQPESAPLATQGVAVSPFLPLSTIQVDGAEEAEVKTEAPALPTEVTTSRGHRLLTR